MKSQSIQEVGDRYPKKIKDFLERDFYLFRLWVLVFGLMAFSYKGFERVVPVIGQDQQEPGKVSESLARDIAQVYFLLNQKDSRKIVDFNPGVFNTISEENGSRFFQLEMSYTLLEDDGSPSEIKEDLFFDDSGWVQSYSTLN